MFSTRTGWSQVASTPGSQHTAQICSGHSQWKLAVSDVLSFSLNTQGQGGRSTADGIDAYGFAWCAFGRAPDCEQIEGELPLTITLSQHWRDSSGPGLHRGGSGAVQQWMIHKVPEMLSLCMGNGSKVPLGQPLFGGYASAPIPGISVRKGDLMKRMQDGDPTVNLDHREIFENKDIQGDWKFELVARTPKVYQEGDLLFGFSGGGPGYGDPLERPPEMIVEDLKKKIISNWTQPTFTKLRLMPSGARSTRRERKNFEPKSGRRGSRAANRMTSLWRSGRRNLLRQKFCNFTGRGRTPSPLGPSSGPSTVTA